MKVPRVGPDPAIHKMELKASTTKLYLPVTNLQGTIHASFMNFLQAKMGNQKKKKWPQHMLI